MSRDTEIKRVRLDRKILREELNVIRHEARKNRPDLDKLVGLADRALSMTEQLPKGDSDD